MYREALLPGTGTPRWSIVILQRPSCGSLRAASKRRLTAHQQIPLRPVRAHLALVVGPAFLDARISALHTLRELVPVDRRMLDAALAELEHLDVVGRAEPRGAEEADEIVEPQRPHLRGLADRRERPRIHAHVVVRDGLDDANRESDVVV